MYKSEHFYQDRLGTNIGKTQKKMPFSHSASASAAAGVNVFRQMWTARLNICGQYWGEECSERFFAQLPYNNAYTRVEGERTTLRMFVYFQEDSGEKCSPFRLFLSEHLPVKLLLVPFRCNQPFNLPRQSQDRRTTTSSTVRLPLIGKNRSKIGLNSLLKWICFYRLMANA